MTDELAALVASVRRELPPVVDRTPFGDNIESLCAAVEALSKDAERLQAFYRHASFVKFGEGGETCTVTKGSADGFEKITHKILTAFAANDAARSSIPGPLNV